MKLFMVAVAVLALFLAGCAKDVQLSEGGAKVKVNEQMTNMEGCKLITTLRVSAQSSVRAFGSASEHAQKDILTTARNAAAEQGANLIVPKGAPKDGKQEFEAYHCK